MRGIGALRRPSSPTSSGRSRRRSPGICGSWSARSRPMMSRGRIEVCYNVQTAVDAKHKLIVAEDVTNAAADRDQLSPMASAAQEVLGGATPVVVADRGYYHGAEIKRCLDAGLSPLVPRPLTSANEARGLF